MVINIADAAKNPGKRYNFDISFMPPSEVLNNELAYFTQNAYLSGEYYYTGGNVLVEGKLRYQISYPCDRCLKKVNYDREIDFYEVFYKRPESYEFYSYQGDEVDLFKAASDYIALDLPVGIVCRADCKGLCLSCGKDLNDGDCGCKNKDALSPFSALKDIIK